MVTSAHDQYTLVLIQLCCQFLNFIVQTEDFFNQICVEIMQKFSELFYGKSLNLTTRL